MDEDELLDHLDEFHGFDSYPEGWGVIELREFHAAEHRYNTPVASHDH